LPHLRRRFAVLLAIATCWFAPLHAATSSRTAAVQLTVGGHHRTYRLHSPPPVEQPRATESKMPLVVVLHGAGATAGEVERRYHWDPLADREHFVVAYPQAIDRRWDDSGTGDVEFLGALLDDVSHRYPIDASRIFVTGISNGGVMTYRAGCALAERVAAIGPVAAWFPDCLPTTPVSVVHVHGLEDKVLGFRGGSVSPSVPEGLAHWRRADARSEARTEQRDGEVTHTTWTQCAPGTAIELYTIDHGRHEWPGAVPKPGNDRVSHALDATATIWAFFAAHPRA
jgi:polyhydroxybutyrate depolymerase